MFSGHKMVIQDCVVLLFKNLKYNIKLKKIFEKT